MLVRLHNLAAITLHMQELDKLTECQNAAAKEQTHVTSNLTWDTTCNEKKNENKQKISTN